ncbi:MAG TPA: hypothetical protein RMH99_19590 [Sandaracinaceae bacterium LLY-WYZ-13_1]|nr:hypothetical protein [Sandaracinaceae bacterium LLY-WYZ-13_1]
MTSLRRARFIALSACLASSAFAACADGGGGDGGVDGGPGLDAGPGDDAGPEACPDGQHRCGGGCIDDLENLPENGCRLGCGEPCPTPPDGVASCTDEGECTTACEPPFMEVDGECVCTPTTCEDLGWMCGAPDDGCGAPLDCGTCDGEGECSDGVCGCPEDAREPNDSRLSVDGVVDSIPNEDWTAEYDAFGIHAADDVDWLSWDVSDSGTFDSNPTIRIELSGIPDGSDYDLAAYYVCDEGSEETTCAAGASDNTVGRGCRSGTSGTSIEVVTLEADCGRGLNTNDDGTLYVRIHAESWGGSCMPYTLSFDVSS